MNAQFAVAALLAISSLTGVYTANERMRLIAPVPTPADQASSFRDSRTAQEILSYSTRREDGSSLDNKRFKCQVFGLLYRFVGQKFPEALTVLNTYLPARLTELLRNCSSQEMRLDDVLNQPIIFPGTNWCGRGNVADDLGVFSTTDACCKAHDECDDVIKYNESRYNLLNPYVTTRSHCQCDKDLLQCFRNVDNFISDIVGYIFFSILQTQCFDFNYPKVGCLNGRHGLFKEYCVKYQLDETQPKKWQWFDQEPYF